MAPESFSELLVRLNESHERALEKLRKDNVRLSQEVYRLQGWTCRLEDSDSQPDTETTPDLPNSPSKKSFPTHLPGMPTELARPHRYGDRLNSNVSELNSLGTLAMAVGRRSSPTRRGTALLPVARGLSAGSRATSIVPEPMDVDLRGPLRHKPSAGVRAANAVPESKDVDLREPLRLTSSPSLGRALSAGSRKATKIIPEPVEVDVRGVNEKKHSITIPDTVDDPAESSRGSTNSADAAAQVDDTGLHKLEDRRPSAAVIVWRRNSMVLESAVANLQKQNFAKQKQRFRQLLELRGELVTPRCLMKALQKRGRADYTIDRAKLVILELTEMGQNCELHAVRSSSSNNDIGIDLESFVQLMIDSDFQCEPEANPAVHEVRRVLLPQAVEEVIEKVTRPVTLASAVVREASNTEHFPPHRHKQLAVLNAVVGLVVVVSITCLGVSMDVEPSWKGWVVLECSFALVFIAEVIIKCCLLGFKRYISGSGWKWNWFDFIVTATTVVDVSLTLITLDSGVEIPAVQLAVVLRTFRLARIARLVKLLHTPVLAELANMLAGFQVGIPCLLWVMVLLFIVFYVVGTIFRQLAGPHGASRIAACGATGDSIGDSDDPQCQPHLLYGEEFFGTLRTSVFTVFRCVLGDCSSEAGKSLTATFSRGYGLAFDVTYCCGMVLIIVGLFNIIAAIFVETTISGLKYNNVQRKYARMYESRYVQQRLEALVTRIQELLPQQHKGEISLNEDEFDEVMQDEGVNSILEDLDVALSNRIGLFDIFDSDNNGSVKISELLATLMKIRGEPQKSDMIASWVALRSLNERFQEFERLVLENQKRLLDCLG